MDFICSLKASFLSNLDRRVQHRVFLISAQRAIECNWRQRGLRSDFLRVKHDLFGVGWPVQDFSNLLKENLVVVHNLRCTIDSLFSRTVGRDTHNVLSSAEVDSWLHGSEALLVLQVVLGVPFLDQELVRSLVNRIVSSHLVVVGKNWLKLAKKTNKVIYNSLLNS